MASSKEPIDLFRGHPNPDLLPVHDLFNASTTVLSTPSIYIPGLQYGPDAGYHPLRQHVAGWLTSFYCPESPVSEDRICITGGASQNLACILQVFTDPAYTRNVWMVAPTYHLASRMFDDAGFAGRLRGIPEDEEGIDVSYLGRGLMEMEKKAKEEGNTQPVPYAWPHFPALSA
jgi:DNA-binding transcriptional MocR family regulator